uniref:NADH-ubiquinone oxidoreductase chain 6 n=1 Tax=Caulerpa ashmeadii TaxID=177078 RepID=A0A6B9VX22_9CHLO|nr:NADH dehydrogenase subunit 6 [Caulerpa ashmeadii]QHQ73231.1 NADH dehydrogenase subunit 6 [Caulerpa ashmeadii]
MNQLFALFSSLALVSACLVIQVANPVHSVLFLILVFFNSAGILLLLGLEFFAMSILIVYIGAIAVLFLFVVMMLNIKLESFVENKYRYLPIGVVLGGIFLFEMFCIIDPALAGGATFGAQRLTNWFDVISTATNVEGIGLCIYTFYSGYFLMAGLILLIAMVGAIALTHHQQTSLKTQKIHVQNARQYNKTVQKIGS